MILIVTSSSDVSRFSISFDSLCLFSLFWLVGIGLLDASRWDRQDGWLVKQEAVVVVGPTSKQVELGK